MADPELVVLDEPTSGLDPLGRREVREIVLALREAGKTVFFSSHILADVEAIADRVAILVGGKLHEVGRVSELIDGAVLSTTLCLRLPPDGGAVAAAAVLEPRCRRIARRGEELELELGPDADVDQMLAEARALGASVLSVTPRTETLEDLFVRRARIAGSEGLGAPRRAPTERGNGRDAGEVERAGEGADGGAGDGAAGEEAHAGAGGDGARRGAGAE
jgi:ABC-2 type transport system ATP-binding protein